MIGLLSESLTVSEYNVSLTKNRLSGVCRQPNKHVHLFNQFHNTVFYYVTTTCSFVESFLTTYGSDIVVFCNYEIDSSCIDYNLVNKILFSK